MSAHSSDHWRDAWLNKPFNLPFFNGDGLKVLTSELEFIQLEANECVLLVRTERMVHESFLPDGQMSRITTMMNKPTSVGTEPLESTRS